MTTLISNVVRFIRGVMFRYVPGMMSCLEFNQFIDDYLAQELSPKETRLFELHLKVCADCQTYLAEYKKTIALNKAAWAEEKTEDLGEIPDELIQAILKAKQQKLPEK